jgi:hypothetical protein
MWISGPPTRVRFVPSDRPSSPIHVSGPLMEHLHSNLHD